MDPKRSPRSGMGTQPGAGSVPPGRPGARQAPGLGDMLDQLGRDIQQLRVDFERFFNGALPFPPEELRGRVQAQIRQLRGMSNLATAVDTFRLGDLEARFNSYNELFNRRVRDQEEGRAPVAHAVPSPAPRRFDPAQGITLGARIDPEAAEALYHGLAASPGDSPRFDLDSFQTYLARQVAAIREKTGCDQVQFRLANEDGKVKLKARPVTAREGS